MNTLLELCSKFFDEQRNISSSGYIQNSNDMICFERADIFRWH